MNPYVVFLMYLMAILGFVALTLLLNRMLGPKPVASAVKLEPFECGATPVSALNVKAVPIKYYAIAIIFILFDLETVFLFIWALGAQPLDRLHALHLLRLHVPAGADRAVRLQGAADRGSDRMSTPGRTKCECSRSAGRPAGPRVPD